MKNNSALKWIWANSKGESIKMVLLIISNALLAVLSVSMAVFAKQIIDAAQNGNKDELIKNAVILLVVIIAQILLKIASKSLEVRISGRLEIKYKTDLFSQILGKDYLEISKHHSGELMARLTSDITVVSDGVTTILPNAISMVVRLVCAFVVMLMLDKYFALIILTAAIVLFTVIRLFRGSIKRLHKQVQETDSKVRAFMQETIESLLVIKIFGVGKKMREHSEELQGDNYSAKIKRNRWSVFANLGFLSAVLVGYLFALVWSSAKLYMGTITFGTLTAIMQLIAQVQTPITGLSGVIPQYYSMLASAERIMEIEEMQSSAVLNKDGIEKDKLVNGFRKINFDNVSFSYDRDCVIENASFEIDKNDFVVISGISGIGKSTLFKLLVGVLPPKNGTVSVLAGEEKYYADKYIRPLFAYVPQGNMLFSGTIRDNIRFINDKATDEEIMRAARISCADGFINELPDGLDTVLLENGHGLSEGQVQRLAVARAVLTSAPVLLLDEATSALDEATEKQLLSNIRALKNKTCIIISHKNAAYEICNKELKIEQRKILLTNNIKNDFNIV